MQATNSRKPLFLARNINKFNRGTARSPPAKLLIKSEESSDVSNWKSTTSNNTDSTAAGDDKNLIAPPSTSTNETDTSSVLTTSSSGVPPPLIIPKVPEILNKCPPERIGQTSSYGDCFVDDQQQVKFNYNSYKSVFLSKGYILYRSNSLKRAKEVIFFLKINLNNWNKSIVFFKGTSKSYETNGREVRKICSEMAP